MKTMFITEKVRTVAQVAKFFVESEFEDTDQTLAAQMVEEGIRKFHDNAVLVQDNGTRLAKGKFLGHANWSQKALKILEQHNYQISKAQEYLSHEHVVPANFIVKSILFSNPIGTDLEMYIDQLRDLAIVAIIADKENDFLYKNGHGMPEGWKIGDDPWARYEGELKDQISSDWTPSFTQRSLKKLQKWQLI